MGKKKKDMTLAELLVEISEFIDDIAGNVDKKGKRELWTVFHQRIAFAFGSLVFTFIGIPIASIVKRGEVVISFGISIAATSVYYILFALAQTIASHGGLPPMLCLWLPNILLIGIGSFFLRKAVLS
jgi:lipopolysaccharide export system permease protein